MDSVIKSDFHYQNHTDELTHITTQPTENIILERNNELRKNEGAIRDLGAGGNETWGRQVASIPFIMFERAIRDGYQLNSKDNKHAEKELFRYLASEEGKKCMIRSKM